MTIFDFTSYNLYLAAELEQRKVENPLYSLRSMATHIGVSAATLSQVIKGQKKLSEKKAIEISNQALRHYHRSMLNKAQAAMLEQTNKEKFIGSETFTISINDLNEAKDIVENCFQQLLQLSLQLSLQSKNKTHVYHAGIQMFQLNKPFKKEF